MTSRDVFRAQVLETFGVTEEDLAALESVDGYQAAKAEADRQFEAFRERVLDAIAPVPEGSYRCANCSGVFEFDPKWSDEDARQEAAGLFTPNELVNAAVVCDDCYRRMGL